MTVVLQRNSDVSSFKRPCRLIYRHMCNQAHHLSFKEEEEEEEEEFLQLKLLTRRSRQTPLEPHRVQSRITDLSYTAGGGGGG